MIPEAVGNHASHPPGFESAGTHKDLRKVAYITMQFPVPTETFAISDIAELRRRGAEVTVLALTPTGSPGQKNFELPGGAQIQVIRSSPAILLQGLLQGIKHPLMLLRLKCFLFQHLWRRPKHLAGSLVLLPSCLGLFAEIVRFEPDVVHLFWGHYPALLGFLVKQNLPSTVLSHFLGAYDLDMRFAPSIPVALSADAIFTHTGENLQVMSECGIPEERIQLVRRGTRLPEEAQYQKVPQRIIAAASLKPRKAWDDIISTFRIVHERWPDASLVIAGDGPLREELKTEVRRLKLDTAVEFLGHVDQACLFAEMEKSQILLHLSLKDWLPNVIKEAAARRNVPVVSDTTSIEELVNHGTTGWIVPLRSPEQAAAHIDALFAEPERMEAFAEAAERLVREDFNVRDTMSKVVTTWTRLLNPH